MKKRRTDSDEKAKSSKHKKATKAPTSVDGHLSKFADFAVPLFFCLLLCPCKSSSEKGCSLGVVKKT